LWVIEERYGDVGEARCIDLGYEVFYVVVNAMKLQLNETGEVNMCPPRQLSARFIKARLRGTECKVKSLETD
jgi:hypothetical protein